MIKKIKVNVKGGGREMKERLNMEKEGEGRRDIVKRAGESVRKREER
jgi:hypothetical protein